MKQLLFIVGSQRRDSFNRRLAEEVALMLEGSASARILSYEDVPFMNQDIEFPAPVAVSRVRAEVQASDGIWIFTPEYNGSYPGGLKNLLDWLSRPLVGDGSSRETALTGKKLAISSVAGKSAGAGVREKLAELLGVMRLDVMTEPQVGIALPGDAFSTDEFELTEEQRSELAAQGQAFLEYLDA